jgi:hypothetical protein
VDLVGSTHYKQFYADKGDNAQWLRFFELFFTEFPERFAAALQHRDYTVSMIDSIWKTLGDEILFRFVIKKYRQTETIILGFLESIQAFQTFIQTKALNAEVDIAVKGAAWISEFPVQNAKVASIRPTDYIGPSIDVGFRIAKFADKRKLVVSVEVARLLLERTNGLRFYYDGEVPLKGAFGGKPYPIIWIDALPPDNGTLESRLREKTDNNNLIQYCDTLMQSDCNTIKMPFFPEGEDFNTPYPGYESSLEEALLIQARKTIPPDLDITEGQPLTPSEATDALFSRFEETLTKKEE